MNFQTRSESRPDFPMAQVFVIQTVILLCLSALVWFVSAGNSWPISAFIGGLAAIVPNALFAKFAFLFSARENARKMLFSFFLGELIKLAITALVFLVAFVSINSLRVEALFGFFIVFLVFNNVLDFYFLAQES